MKFEGKISTLVLSIILSLFIGFGIGLVSSKYINISFAPKEANIANPPRLQGPPVNLPSSYDTGIKYDKAAKKGKLIAANFYVDWCHYCQRFAPILDSIRKDYSSKFTFVTVNVEKPENRKLSEEFKIEGFPSLFLVNPKTGKKVMVPQNLYSDKATLEKEFDKFYKANK